MPRYVCRQAPPLASMRRGRPRSHRRGTARLARYAVAGGRPEPAAIQFSPTGTSRFRTVSRASLDTTDSFDVQVALPASGTVRVAWTGPAGAEFFSRTIAVRSR